MQRLARASTAAGAGVVVFLLVNNLIVLSWATPSVLRFAASDPNVSVPIFFAFPFPVLLFSLEGPAAAAWWVLLVCTILVSVGMLAYTDGRDALDKTIGILMGRPAPALSEPNAFFVIARLFSVSVLASELVAIVAVIAGHAPQVPEGLASAGDLSIFIQLAHASVWEEVVTRVLLLGLPLLLIHRVGNGRLDRKPIKYAVGGGITLDGPAVALLLFSASVFGVAHVPGWDLWKVPTAFLAGLALGYLFLRYGLGAAIALHFLTDYLLASSYFFGIHSSITTMVAVLILVLAIVGVANAGRYLIVLRDVIRARRIPEYLGGPRVEPAAAPTIATLEPAPAGPDT